MVYELVTPSDPVTFCADSDAIAWAIAVFIGNGKAGCRREDGRNLNTMLAFCPSCDIDAATVAMLGVGNVGVFILAHLPECIAAMDSFAIGGFADRAEYDAAINGITDTSKRKAFREINRDRRTSMNDWVGYAHRLADWLRERQAKEAKK